MYQRKKHARNVEFGAQYAIIHGLKLKLISFKKRKCLSINSCLWVISIGKRIKSRIIPYNYHHSVPILRNPKTNINRFRFLMIYQRLWIVIVVILLPDTEWKKKNVLEIIEFDRRPIYNWIHILQIYGLKEKPSSETI